MSKECNCTNCKCDKQKLDKVKKDMLSKQKDNSIGSKNNSKQKFEK